MDAYLHIVEHILEHGTLKENRTGMSAYTVASVMFEHDMKQGYPLLTTKSVPFSRVASELEFFIKGITDKRWLQERNNHIWDEWANPKKAPYGHDPKSKQRMLEERDLGPIYGWQWRHWNAPYDSYDTDYTGAGIDQLENLVTKLEKNPEDRRMIVTAWNPSYLDEMGLPACHYGFQVTVINDTLNLAWNQRSVDTMLGLPFNIASYALLLHLLTKQANLSRDEGTKLKEGKLAGFLMDTHIYKNHVEGAKEQLMRVPFDLPSIETPNFTSIFDWQYTDTKIIDYQHHKKIDFPIAV